MNQEQFNDFLRVQQEQQQQITQILQLLVTKLHDGTPSATRDGTPTQSETSNTTKKISILKNFDVGKFDPDSCRIEDFIDYFDAKCQILSIDINIKKDLLLSCLTPEIYRDVKVALIPNFDASTFTDIKRKLLDIYRIKKTRYRALTEFWSCIRENTESMEHYANRLKQLSRDCGYDDQLVERQLRDRFATGLNHTELETDLKQKWPDLQETYDGITKEVSFIQIFSVAQSREQAEYDTPGTSIHRIRKHVSRDTKHRQSSSPRKIHSDQCLRCGKHDKHKLDMCVAKNHTCDACGIEGHFESCCIKSGRAFITGPKKNTNDRRNNVKLQKIRNNQMASQSSLSTSDDSDDEIICAVKGSKDCKKIDVYINGRRCTMDWDPGSTYSIISTTFWKQIGTPTLTEAPKLTAYGNNKLKPKGITDVTVEVGDRKILLPVVVMRDADPMLFGLRWSEMFDMTFPKSVYSIRTGPTTMKQVLDSHTSLFDGKLGKVKDYLVNIHIKAGAEPVHMPARPIKFNMRKNIEQELERLISEGIIHPIDPNITPIEWATPTVNIVKPTGQIRICGDYRSTINSVLIKHLHPVPIFDQLRQHLSNGKMFSKIDLKDAYLQFEIAPESKKYLTLATHKGYFQYNRMPFGIATAPSIFQHYLDKLLGDLSNVAVYFDDIAVAGKNLQEHLQLLSTVFDRLEKAGLKVNLKKCSFLQKEIEYLGHTIDPNGIRPTKTKIEAITNAVQPTSMKELRSFLGLVNFYERFIPHLHSICADLHTLTGNKQQWQWSEHENQIFEKTKECIAASKPLIAFDERRQLYLACDASEKGVGAVLFHKDKNVEQPIAFASRKLRSAESNYSVIDREALAILFGITKFDQYLRGTKFKLVTDHKPLIHILGPQRNLPKLVNNRLIRWALIIGSYDYEIYHRKGENNIIADCLSRLPNAREKPSPAECAVHKITARGQNIKITDLALTEEIIKGETSKDPVLSQVRQYLKTGWRNIQYDNLLNPFFRKRNELSIENKIVMWQGRIIIPETLRHSTLTYLHRGHPGISAMRALSRFYVWWPALDEDIDSFVKRCRKCQENRPCNPELPVYSWSIPERVWERLHIDFAGPFEGTYWLVLCDALSKWIEVKPMKHITTRNLCYVLDEVFSTFGLPEMIVSDNGPQFTSHEFKEYCRNHGIVNVTSAPYHPRTNGLAERLVRTFKTRMLSSEGIAKNRLNEFLFSYRNTPHSTTGKSPSQMMFGRQLNCLLSNIRPNNRRELQFKQVQGNIASTSPNYRPGERVFIKTRLDKIWQPATISARTHRYSYVVTTPSGEEKRRHADHIRPRVLVLSPTPELPGDSPPRDDDREPDDLPVGSSFQTPLIVEPPIAELPVEPTFQTPPTSANHALPDTSTRQLQPRRSKRLGMPPRRLIEEM